MEAQAYFQGWHNRSGFPQSATDKQGMGNGEHFIVEELLDLSNEEEEGIGITAGEYGGYAAVAGLSSGAGSSTVTAIESRNKSSTAVESVAAAGFSGDIFEPYADLAELEWLSNFVEESFSSDEMRKLGLISGIKSTSSSSSTSLGDDGVAAEPPAILPEAPRGRARSKRSRVAGPCNWSSGLLPAAASSSSESDAFVIQNKPAKKKEASPASAPASDGRKCLHCATNKTPQWRAGPMGPKTLCNACGVRYKSGRLVPEYRPAASPTFVLSKHSNSHRKVLELRRQKGFRQQQVFLAGAAGGGGGGGGGCFYKGSTAAAAATAGDDFLTHHHLGPDFRQVI
ncbi:GATA transcription factor 9 [Apostasia shenzhenica]|uniref:GATA transcription factor 9 n=1 Tax=Apostasia shenzhenica TaxID=1088818 RepID=A0A2I0ANV0_9ASPA|nr:GATA transcription factor 9 [Apostasia shenzhenica]